MGPAQTQFEWQEEQGSDPVCARPVRAREIAILPPPANTPRARHLNTLEQQHGIERKEPRNYSSSSMACCKQPSKQSRVRSGAMGLDPSPMVGWARSSS